MKSGMAIGQAAEVVFTVTEDMYAAFEGKSVHKLLSTASLVQQMEWAARKTILPYLESHEEGMGARIDVHHLLPTTGGMDVTVKARITGIRDNQVECAVEASTFKGKIASGSVVQAIVAREWISRKISETKVIENILDDERSTGKTGKS